MNSGSHSAVLPQCVVLAGGGTGGHLMPGLAVAAELRRRGVPRIIFVGTARGLEARLVPEAGYELRLIEIGGLKQTGWRRQLRTWAQLPGAVLHARRILRETRAELVLGIGGYASGPVLAAAHHLRLPLVLLEINAQPGLANRWAAKWASATALAFAEAAPMFPRAVLTGIPVRPEFFAPAPDSSPEPEGLRLLCFGGGQGARPLNEALQDWLRQPELSLPFQEIVHQTGGLDWDRVCRAYLKLPGQHFLLENSLTYLSPNGWQVRAMPFIQAMAEEMRGASLVLCRSGAGTLAELAALGKPAILVPFPGAADQHQLRNAQAYVSAGAARLLEQSLLTSPRLDQAVREIAADARLRQSMREAALRLAHPQAALRITDLMLQAFSRANNPAVSR